MRAAYRRLADGVVRRPWIAIAIVVALYGVRVSEVDRLQFRSLAAAPFTVALAPEYQFLYGSPFTFLIGNYYLHHGIDPVVSFYLVHGVGVALFFIAVVVALRRICGPEAWRLALMVLLTSPLLYVVLFWFGKSDPFLLAFYFLMLAAESAATQIILCVLIVACHRELGAALLLTHLVVCAARRVPVVTGLVGGEALLLVYERFLLSARPVSRAAYALEHGRELWLLLSSHPVLHLVLTLGPFWIYMTTPSARRGKTAALVALGFALAAGSYDFTRVFVIAVTPLLVDIARSIAVDAAATGETMVGGIRVSLASLWPLMLVQAQLVGAKLFSAGQFERFVQ